LLDVIARGAAVLAEAHRFGGRSNLDYSRSEARQLLRGPHLDRVALMSALMCDVAHKDEKVRATPFCAMFGQGHQNFLERLASVPKGIVPKELQNETTSEELNSPGKLEQALFQDWNRIDRTQSFRWDPMEDRRYALRFVDPSGDKGLTVHGANRLASLGLPLLTAVPKRERGEARPCPLMTSWKHKKLMVSWPIWSRAATLSSIIRMLNVVPGGSTLPGWGQSVIYSAERISVGKFFNFTRATPKVESAGY
jgi:hypothetical protein